MIFQISGSIYTLPILSSKSFRGVVLTAQFSMFALSYIAQFSVFGLLSALLSMSGSEDSNAYDSDKDFDMDRGTSPDKSEKDISANETPVPNPHERKRSKMVEVKGFA